MDYCLNLNYLKDHLNNLNFLTNLIRKFDINGQAQDNWFFNIRRIDVSHKDYDESLPHQHHFHQFLFFESGSGKHTVDGQQYDVKPHSIHFISPNHIHRLFLEKNTKGYVCMFKEELFFIHNETNKFLEEIGLFSHWNSKPIVHFLKDDFNELHQLLILLEDEFMHKKMRKNEILLMGLKMFLMKSSRVGGEILGVRTNKKRQTIIDFLGLIDENYNKNLPVTFYSEKLNITSTHLNRIVNEVYSKSVSEFISERIVLEAKRVIRLSSKSIKEISFELGFEDPSYFARFFKKHVSITPVEYRKTAINYSES